MKYLILFILLVFVGCDRANTLPEPKTRNAFEVTYYPSGEKSSEVFFNYLGNPIIVNTYNKKGEITSSERIDYY